MRQKILTFLTIVLMICGIGLFTYPAISNLYYEHQQEELTEYYDNLVVETVQDDEDFSEQFQECYDYNEGLLKGGVLLTDPFDESQLDPASMPYAGLLNTDGNGAMGYIQIPAIDVNLMIYHGTDESVLQKGVGHLQGSSLPVGGQGSHSVLSAHSGLNNKKLFTDLDQLVIGDVFYIHVLGEVIAYQVDSIKVVLPHETDDLMINSTEDYVTLITCTPYAVNTHRLLVRGTRISYEEAVVTAENTEVRVSTWEKQYLEAIIIGIIIFLLIIIVYWVIRKIRRRLRRKRRRRKNSRRA